MTYLIALFIPPLYFLLKGKWISFIIHSIIYSVALLFTISMIGAFIGIPLWLFSSICAIWALRKEMMVEHATIMATKMAEAMQKKDQTQNERPT